ESNENDEKLPNPVQAVAASALAFATGAVLPLLGWRWLLWWLASVALVVIGLVGALLGRTPVVKSSARVLVCGWMAMGTTFGLTKLIGSNHGVQI
ncbi:hypothetical protein V6Z11_A04G147800, partial [Gossypium hirsutum]